MASILSFPRAGLLCGTVLFSSLASLGQQSNPQFIPPVHNMTVRGMVETKDGNATPVGVMVFLQTQQGAPIASQPVDSAGTFEFDELARGIYTLTFKAENYQTCQESVDLSRGGTTLSSVQVFLVPLDKAKINLSSLPAMTDQAAPRSARREFEKGARAWREKNLSKARDHFEKAVAAFPCYARAQCALAEVDLVAHQPASAETRYKQAIHCDSTYMDAFYQLGRLYLAQNKPQDSETIFSQGLRLSPNAWVFHYEMAAAHFALGKYHEASQDFLTAQSLHPDMPAEFHAKLADVYLKTGEYSKALAEMDTYLRLSPEGPYAASAKKVSEVLRRNGVTEPGPQASAAPPAQP
ncbi:MAG: tetratricopeptide repeat protein [Terriglobia bacterium]